MDLILITNDPARAAAAQAAGVDRIMVDLEIAGKVARQGHLDTVISRHQIGEIAEVRTGAPDSLLVVRTDPWPQATAHIEASIDAGADVLMLPMFEDAHEVSRFVDKVGGRARTLLLLETPQAVDSLQTIVKVPGVDEIHVGLNDLHLGLRRRFMFELVADGTVGRIASEVLNAGIKFGFGGVARMGGGPLRPELVLSEHVRLNSTQVILSRDFHRCFDEADPRASLSREVAALRATLLDLRHRSPAALESNAVEFRAAVAEIAKSRP